jgi:chorismate dehydratase
LKKSIDLVLVSYLNTIPFIKGLETKKDHPFNIIFAKPADCASYFLQDKCDIALIPVGALPHAENYNLVTSYCIGCDGEVRTVCLLSNSPIKEITEVYLDGDSRTSVLLCKIICKELYKRKITYIEGLPEDLTTLNSNQAILAIGDKVFDLEKKYAHKIDMGSAWKELTGLPFAFAVFVSKFGLPEGITQELNDLLAIGIQNIPSLDLKDFSHIDNIDSYFSQNISYNFDKRKWIAMKQFIEYVNMLE